MKIPSLKILRQIWAGLALLILVCGLVLFRPVSGSEVSGNLVFCMFVLSFPVGWLGLALTLLLSDAFGPAYQSRLHLSGIWAIYFVLGYLQWFVVVPLSFYFVRRKHEPTA
jgi:hypothetical protein